MFLTKYKYYELLLLLVQLFVKMVMVVLLCAVLPALLRAGRMALSCNHH